MNEIEEELKDNGFGIIDKIGQGGFGRLFLVNWLKYPGLQYVAKLIPVGEGNESVSSSFLPEISSLQALNNRNIVNIFKTFEIKNYNVMILEYCQNGSLKSYIESNGPLSLENFTNVAFQCLCALNAMHKMGIVHLDLKPDNILLTSNYRVKVADFGLASFMNDEKQISLGKGSHQYMSPERFYGSPFDAFKADIWSLGVTFYFLLTGTIPWDMASQKSLVKSIMTSGVFFPDQVDPTVERLVMSMLDKNPAYRPLTDELLCSKLFSDKAKVQKFNSVTKYFSSAKLVLSNGKSDPYSLKGVYKSFVISPKAKTSTPMLKLSKKSYSTTLRPR